MATDGDGWTTCAAGHQHWGRYGAAGLLLRCVGSRPLVLLQHRAAWSHHGGTWGLPGGARGRDEPAPAAALRETLEETGLDPAYVTVEASYVDDHGGWSYVTVLATTPDAVPLQPRAETVELRWVPLDEVTELPLHPGFAGTWPLLRKRLAPTAPGSAQ